MKHIIILMLFVFSFNTIDAQIRRGGLGMNRNRMPQTNNQPTEKDIEKHKRMMEERKEEYIANFLTTLEADEFQKEIIKQTLNGFFDEKVALYKEQYDRIFDRNQAVKKLEETYFLELEELISENDMAKIREMIKGDFDENEVKKKERKKKKRKNKNDTDN